MLGQKDALIPGTALTVTAAPVLSAMALHWNAAKGGPSLMLYFPLPLHLPGRQNTATESDKGQPAFSQENVARNSLACLRDSMAHPGPRGVPSPCAPGLTREQTGPGFGDDPRYDCEDF